MKKLLLLLILIPFVLFMSCNQSPYSDQTYTFDMSGSGNASRTAARTMAASSTVISNFEKYEIEVVYVYIALFDAAITDGSGPYDQKTLYNKRVGEGVKLDLATQKLSDVLPEGTLDITEPLGNGVDKIYVGLAPTATIKGYVKWNETVYRTAGDGVMQSDGDTADAVEGVFNVTGYEIPAFSVDEENPPVEPNVKGIYLLLAAGGKKHAGHEDLIFSADSSSLDLKFPLEAGLLRGNDGTWATCSVDWATPYIEGASKYEKYYLKPTGATYYTDIMRVLTDNSGKAILNQLRLGNIANDGSQLLPGEYKLDYRTDDLVDNKTEAELDAIYAEWFTQSADNAASYTFKATEGNNILTCTGFQRADHSGTFTINGTAYDYDCKKIE